MRLANKALFFAWALLFFSACAPKTDLSNTVLELEQQIRAMRKESSELQKRIIELENRSEEMYEETDNRSRQIKEATGEPN